MTIGDIGAGVFAETMTMSFTNLSGSFGKTSGTGTTGSIGGGGLLSSLSGGSLGGLFGGGAGEAGFSFGFGGSFTLADGSSISFGFEFSSGQQGGGSGCCGHEEEVTQDHGHACCHAEGGGDGNSNGVSDILADWMEETLNKSISDLLADLHQDHWKDLLAKTLDQLLGDDDHGCGCATEDTGGFNMADLLANQDGDQPGVGDNSVIIQILGDNNNVEVNLDGDWSLSA